MYHLRQWSFYLTVLAMPLVFAALGAFPQLRSAAQETPLPSVETVFNMNSAELTVPVGYIDQSGLIDPDAEENPDQFKAYLDEEDALKALHDGEIESYYIISADYLASGQVVQYSLNPQLLDDTDGAVRRLLRDNLLQSLDDPVLAARVVNPVEFVREGPPAPVFRFMPADLDTRRLITAGLVVALFVYVINVGGNLLLRALQIEVRASVLEIMVVSTTPGQFIGGKLLGLTTLTLAQAGLTLTAGALVYGRNLEETGPAALPMLALAMSIPYLVLGFLAYCGGVLGVAALWPDFRESALLLAGLRLLSLTPLIGALFILPDAGSMISVGLSVLPLTSHLLMPFRLFIDEVPWWQWIFGLLLLSGWTIFWIWFSFRLFRLNGLLTGRSISPRLVWYALRS